MRTSSHVIGFRHRTIIEMVPLSSLLPEHHRLRKQRERDELIRASRVTDPFPTIDEFGSPADYFRQNGFFRSGWYGVEPDAYVPVFDCLPDGDGVVLEFWSDAGCRVRRGDALILQQEPEWPHSYFPCSVLIPLNDGPMTDALLDPPRSFFRHSDESGFWERIVSDSLDATARLVYADWLDDHDDPHAWVFREPRPFLLGSYRLDWTGAMGRVDCGAPERRRTVWEFARITGRGASVPFTLSGGAPVPQFVAYLLGVTRIRADQRLSQSDRARLVDRTRTLGLSVMADLILGPDDEPICRVTNPVRTLSLFDELADGATVTLPELSDRLRDVNHV